VFPKNYDWAGRGEHSIVYLPTFKLLFFTPIIKNFSKKSREKRPQRGRLLKIILL